jgi:vacuolar-type H+-ATPase subunit H
MRPEVHAIDQVLAAERENQAALERAKLEARSQVDHAREDARRILRRARLRISRIHSLCAEALADRRAALEAEALETPSDISPDADALLALDRGIDRLAARLTSRTRPPGNGSDAGSHG